MIFNTNVATKEPEVGVGRYEANLEGALMCVYENECNYNALIKAVGISEMKYYQETGKDLFVNEAGVFKSFIDKVIAFFKKVIEKIKQLFNKFVAEINKFVLNDKDFVKKYRKVIGNKDFGKNYDLKVKGHKFDWTYNYTKYTGDSTSAPETGTYDAPSQEEKDSKKAYIRKLIAGANEDLNSESEFSEFVSKKFYGEEEEIACTRSQLNEDFDTIENNKKAISEAEKSEKSLIDEINKFIKEIEKMRDKASDEDVSKASDVDNAITKKTNKVNVYNWRIEKLKEASQCYTIWFGCKSKALKDARKEAKARCIKAVQYTPKNEAAYAESSLEDLFAGVTIR